MKITARTTTLAVAALAALAVATAPAAAAPRSPHGYAKPPAARQHDSGRPLARSSALSFWRDATLDCYPTGGGIVGGNGNSVHLSILWKLGYPGTVWAGHYLLYEVIQNGRTYWLRADGTAGTTSPFYGSYRIQQYGVYEWGQQYYNWDGTYSTVYTPWSRDLSFPLSVRTQVRAWVGLQKYSSTTGWGTTVWNLATPLGGTSSGFCSL